MEDCLNEFTRKPSQSTLGLIIPEDNHHTIRRTADFSPCRTWRYTLIREWNNELPRLLFILLNPSTADQDQDDPTNRRAISFAFKWGYGSVVFVNLFAIRSPYPKRILEADDPIGPENDLYIIREANKAHRLICAWGVHGTYRERDKRVLSYLPPILHCLGITLDGHPKHPLYLRGDTKPIRMHRNFDIAYQMIQKEIHENHNN